MADHREAIMFKKGPDGYVFRAPNPWVLGRKRFYLVNEAEKTKLLAVITARSQAVFWVTFVTLISASTAALAYFSGHNNPTTRDFVIMLALLPVWLYAAALVSIRPTARRLQPLLAGLPRTEQRITAADMRRAVRKLVLPQRREIGVLPRLAERVDIPGRGGCGHGGQPFSLLQQSIRRRV